MGSPDRYQSGKLGGEKAWRQSPIVITTALIVCSKLTSWLLEIVHAEWYAIFHDWVPAIVSRIGYTHQDVKDQSLTR